MRDLIRSLVATLELDRECLFCQVVETRGSTPQKAGAGMIVHGDGGQEGTLGGGCVEAEVKQRAIELVGAPGSKLYTYILDHDYAWADGLICGGKMVILASCLRGPDAAAYFRAYREHVETGRGLTEMVVTDPDRAGADAGPLGARHLFDADGRPVASWPVPEAPPVLRALVEPLTSRPRPASRGGVAILPTLPRVRLVIAGAGHVGQAVADLAARADFDVWVLDDRERYANPDRFPRAVALRVGPFERTIPALDLDENTFALIVTRGHGHDQEALALLAPTAAGYVGLIGSRRKIRMIFDALRDDGMSDASLARVAAPVGLEIGSETVEEIAVSIVAELIARRNLGPDSVRPRGWIDRATHPESESVSNPESASVGDHSP
jgi:xanthine dehydrogenase accessory factor